MTDSAHLQKDLARVALGDRAAFARVYQATSGICLASRFVLNRRDAAEDVLQEAFVNVWHHAGSYQAASGQPMTWMISIVRNKALDVVRSAAVRHETEMPASTEGEAIDIPDVRPSPLQLLTEATDALAIRGCMEALDARIGNVSHLRITRACRTRKSRRICERRGSVKAWVRRGLERLKKCMENVA